MQLMMSLLLALADITPQQPIVEQLHARIAQLEQQIEQMQRQYQYEMAVCSGALNASRQFALQPAKVKVAK